MHLIPVRPTLRAAAAFILTAFLALPALALPAPMPEAELLEKSDLVALVRVMSVTCTSKTKDPATGEQQPGYLAKLRVIEAKKGELRPGGEVLVTFRAIPEGALDPWTVFYYSGEEVWTHLIKREGGVTYASTWWNAKGDVVKEPETKELPTTVGESVLAAEAD